MSTTFPGPGERFGRYDIERVLGRGGMGVVFQAVHRDLGRPVALKVMNPALNGDPDYRGRFLREAMVLARLDSPHVVRVHDAGDEAKWLFIATELVAGGDLERLVARRGPLDPSSALRLVADAARGLGDAHRAGILHRDLKPSNVLLRPRSYGPDTAVLCDLGIAKTSDDTHVTTAFIGTPGYMAPERHDGRSATVASDLYELGCVLWTLLAGSAPYRGTLSQVAMAHLQAPAPQLTGTARHVSELNQLMRWLLAKDPAARPTSAGELAEALAVGAERLRGAPAVAVRPRPPSEPPARPDSRPAAAPPPGPRPAGPPAVPPSRSGPPPPVPYGLHRAEHPPPHAAQPRSRVLLLAAILVVLVLVGGGAGLAVVLHRSGSDADATASRTASDDPSGSPGPVGSSGVPTPRDPVVGECRDLTFAELSDEHADAPTVPCGGATAQTIVVAHLSTRSAEAADTVAATCYQPLAHALGVSLARANAAAVVFVYFTPTVTQWKLGARWLRCDAVVPTGSSLEPVPEDLGSVFSGSDPQPRYAACLDASHTVETCGPSSAFTFVDSRSLPGPAAFPGDAALESRATPICATSAGAGWWATWPSRESWAAGRHTLSCWAPTG